MGGGGLGLAQCVTAPGCWMETGSANRDFTSFGWIETMFSFVDYCMLLMENSEDYLGIGLESNDFWIGL